MSPKGPCAVGWSLMVLLSCGPLSPGAWWEVLGLWECASKGVSPAQAPPVFSLPSLIGWLVLPLAVRRYSLASPALGTMQPVGRCENTETRSQINPSSPWPIISGICCSGGKLTVAPLSPPLSLLILVATPSPVLTSCRLSHLPAPL